MAVFLTSCDLSEPTQLTSMETTVENTTIENTTTSTTPTSNSVVIVFNSNGGSSVDILVIRVLDDLVQPIDPVKEGFIFDGWYLDENLTQAFDFSLIPNENVMLYAKWIEDDRPLVTITLVTEYTLESYEITQPAGSILNLPVITDFGFRDGTVIHVGWKTNPNSSEEQYIFSENVMPESSITLYPVFEMTGYGKIIFDTLGGTEIDTVFVEIDSEIVLPEPPTKEGYIFAGWSYNGQPLKKTNMDIVFLYLDAIWKTFDEMFSTITWNTMGGNEIPDSYILKSEGKINESEVPIPVRDGYDFVGWSTSENVNSLPINSWSNYYFSEDTMIYAIWEERPVIFVTITFFTNGGTAVNSFTQEVGTQITTTFPTYRLGYTFAGWFLDPSYTQPITLDVMPETGIIVYAKWVSSSNTNIITFNSNGGTAVSNITGTAGISISAPNDPTKPGYTFGGWYSDTSLQIPYVFDSMPSTSITVYAKWIEGNNGSSLLLNTLIEWGFICSNDVCELQLYEGYVYRVNFNTHEFNLDKIYYSEVEGGYTDQSTYIVIDSNWQMTYDYRMDEDYGYHVYTTMTITGNALTGLYSVTSFTSNMTSQSEQYTDAIDTIDELINIINTLFEDSGVDMDDFELM